MEQTFVLYLCVDYCLLTADGNLTAALNFEKSNTFIVYLIFCNKHVTCGSKVEYKMQLRFKVN